MARLLRVLPTQIWQNAICQPVMELGSFLRHIKGRLKQCSNSSTKKKSPIIGYEPKLSFYTFKPTEVYAVTLSYLIFWTG
jgi:hypothetical protein